MTGAVQWCTAYVDTEPINARFKFPIPRQPTTTMSAWSNKFSLRHESSVTKQAPWFRLLVSPRARLRTCTKNEQRLPQLWKIHEKNKQVLEFHLQIRHAPGCPGKRISLHFNPFSLHKSWNFFITRAASATPEEGSTYTKFLIISKICVERKPQAYTTCIVAVATIACCNAWTK